MISECSGTGRDKAGHPPTPVVVVNLVHQWGGGVPPTCPALSRLGLAAMAPHTALSKLTAVLGRALVAAALLAAQGRLYGRPGAPVQSQCLRSTARTTTITTHDPASGEAPCQ